MNDESRRLTNLRKSKRKKKTPAPKVRSNLDATDENGASIFAVQTTLGHSDQRTTTAAQSSGLVLRVP
jgi:hypothetical protein